MNANKYIYQISRFLPIFSTLSDARKYYKDVKKRGVITTEKAVIYRINNYKADDVKSFKA